MRRCLTALAIGCAALFGGAASAASPAHPPFLMLISIDGLKPEAVLEAEVGSPGTELEFAL